MISLILYTVTYIEDHLSRGRVNDDLLTLVDKEKNLGKI